MTAIPTTLYPGLGEPIKTKRRARLGRWAFAIVVLLVAIDLFVSLATNERLAWNVVGTYLFSEPIMSGLRLTLILTVSSMALGVLLGAVLAVMRMSDNPILAGAARGYIWFFRGTPLLVQMLFWAYASAIYPQVSLGVPFGPGLLSFDYNTVVPLFVAGLLALGLNEGAYAAEIIRAGILGVDEGQLEAARALGMSERKLLRRIVLPQAMRIVVPPLGNATIMMLKTTSLVYAIALPELLTSAKIIYGANFQQIPLLIVVSFWYLLITSLLSIVQSRLERIAGRGFTRREISAADTEGVRA
ncbi:amino acid ABC transporter permease [Nocardioidaceae bacterium SCSIO 66511]|nr:amino acid ABC transporter permease [Nocardioidaceae bacterium SCSIO 66511]